MPDGFAFDLVTLIRVLANDPSARAQIVAALEAGPAPVRSAIARHTVLDGTWEVLVRTDREREPGQDGFIVRDASGRVLSILREVMQAEHDAKTVSSANMADKLGITPEELAKLIKPPPE